MSHGGPFYVPLWDTILMISGHRRDLLGHLLLRAGHKPERRETVEENVHVRDPSLTLTALPARMPFRLLQRVYTGFGRFKPTCMPSAGIIALQGGAR